VEARNRDGPCGLIAGLRVTLEGGDGKPLDVLTDETWMTADKADGHWKSPDYVEAGWRPAAVIARFGEGPWNVAVRR